MHDREYDQRVRVVSLLPSATEIVYALGCDDQLVGVTFECNEPAQARQEKAVVVGGRDTKGMTPAQIDDYVRAQLAAGQELYTLHADALAGLAPDLILTQDLCRVCALPTGHVEDALDHLGCTADVLALDPYSLEDVLTSIEAVGGRLGVPTGAAAVVHGIRQRLAAVSEAVAELARPHVALIEWVDPPFTAGHWIPDMVTAAGGRPVAASGGGRSSRTSWSAIRATRPDVVLVAPCGYGLTGALEQACTVVPQVPNVPVWAIDADAFIVRPGPRLVDGVEAIASILHPRQVPAPPPGRVARAA